MRERPVIGYVCKYTPVEFLEAMGAEMARIEPEVTDFDQADACMHANVCSFVKGVLEVAGDPGYRGIVLTTCCDSVRRLYDVLKKQYPDKFLYLLDVPRKVNDFAAELYKQRLLQMKEAFLAFFGEPAGEKEPGADLRRGENAENFRRGELREDFGHLLLRKEEAAGLRSAPENKNTLRIGLMGARCPGSIRALLAARGILPVFDLSCNGLDRSGIVQGAARELEKPEKEQDEESLVRWYADKLLCQIPCARMVKATGRERFLEGFLDSLDGMIYHTVKFCDMYSFEYARLIQTETLPVLKVETDLTSQCEGQIRTRVEAFLEALEQKKNIKASSDVRGGRERLGTVYVMGIDSGSTSTNAVIMNGSREIVASAIIRTGAKTAQSAGKILELLLEKSGLKREDLKRIVSTGYGRVSIPYADTNVTEISCHGKGAMYFRPDVRTILDIGGQDSKAIRLNEKGEVTDFVMNDKCAAGTGRFLEAMARTLELPIEELGSVSLGATEEIQISSMCTVFAESEVISLIANNKEKADIARGVHNAIAGKAFSLLKRTGICPAVMMTGGVARNTGVVKAVEERIGEKLYVLENPDLVGAVGAALYALEE